MVRVGVVSDVDTANKKIRVYYPALSNMVSDWLFVLQRPFHGAANFAPFHVGVQIGEAEEHSHPAYVSYGDNVWLPKIDESVLVLYPEGCNTDGYVLGVIP